MLAEKSKNAARKVMTLSHETRRSLLLSLANTIAKNEKEILKVNSLDMQQAEIAGLNPAMKDRLLLDSKRISSMVEGVRAIADQPEVVNTFYGEFKDAKGLVIKKQSIPLGVILMIFESRPNVVVDCAALAIKSSNAIILKGGKEARHSNEYLGDLIQTTIEKYIPRETVQVIKSDDREQVRELLALSEFIDVVVPRGGERLINYVHENAKMPVIAHFKGLCHMYIDSSADKEKILDLVINSKTHRVGVCNAIETLLVHKSILPDIAKVLTLELQQRGTELRVDKEFKKHSETDLQEATVEDWSTEYLDNILSIKTVASIEDAIEHIARYGSFHTECIVAEDPVSCERFLYAVDASCIMINASSRFNDGGQLGLGAELGISTSKLHAYGPMGAAQMTATRYVVVGNGHVRS